MLGRLGGYLRALRYRILRQTGTLHTVPYEQSVLSSTPSITPEEGLFVPTPEDEFTQPIQIKVKNGKPVTVLVDLEMHVAEFKGMVERVTGVAKGEQRFYQEECSLPPCQCCRAYKGRHTLKHYHVKPNDTITIIPLLCSSNAKHGYSLTQAVTVKSLTNRTYSVLMDPEMLVMEFKDLVSETVGPPVFEIRLIFVNKDVAIEKGKAYEMLDGYTLSHYGIQEGALIYLVLRILS